MSNGSQRNVIILIGAILATAITAIAPPRPDLTVSGQYVIATMVFAAILWVSRALPLPVTALLISVLLAYSAYSQALKTHSWDSQIQSFFSS
jgi:di/tricarboxylate transporter